MKKYFAALALLLAAAFGTLAQSSTTFTITVVAPTGCTVTLAPNPVSKSGGSLYAGQAGVVNFNVSACSIATVSTATATWDGTALTVVAPFTVNITAAQAMVGSHTLVLTIPQPTLSLNTPLLLPNATAGQPYSVDVASATNLLKNGQPCSTCIFSATSLPSGLTLSANGVVSGVPSGTGSSSLTFIVTDNPLLAMNFSRPFRYRR